MISSGQPVLRLANGKVIRRVIIYIRVSTAREDMKSPEQQLAICLAYCALKGLEVIGLPVEDLDLSGAEFAKRKIHQMIKRIRAKEADAIVVWEYSRFGRTLVGSLFHIKELEAAGGDLLSATQDIDATTPAGRYMRDQFLRLAEYQLDCIRANWMTAHDRRRRAGLPHSGQPRFGYVRCSGCRKFDPADRSYSCTAKCGGLLVPETLLGEEPNPNATQERAEALEKSYDIVLNDGTYYDVARESWKRGITSLRGNKMGADQWRAVMDSGFAAGLLRARSSAVERPKTTRPDTYDIWSDGQHKELISQKIWDAYVDWRVNQSKKITAVIPMKYPLSGVPRCGALVKDGTPCLGVMTIRGAGKEPDGSYAQSFGCSLSDQHVSGKSNNMKMKHVERVVAEWLEAGAKGEADLGQISMDRAAAAAKSLSQIPGVEAKIAGLERKKRRINEGYENGLTTLDEAKVRMEEVNTALREARADLARYERESVVNAAPKREEFQGLIRVWERATAKEKRRALKKVIDHVRIIPAKQAGTRYSHAVVIPMWADESERVISKKSRRRQAA